MFDWVHFLTFTFATAFTPGINNITCMGNVSRVGFKKNLPFNVGIFSGFAIISLLCSFLCNKFEKYIDRFQTPLLFLGAAYMLYLAWHIYKTPPIEEYQSPKFGFFAGFFQQFINPKLYFYVLVSLQSFILPVYHDNPTMLVFFSLFLAFSALVSTLCWGAFGNVFKYIFKEKASIGNTVLAILMVGCAVALFF